MALEPKENQRPMKLLLRLEEHRQEAGYPEYTGW